MKRARLTIEYIHNDMEYDDDFDTRPWDACINLPPIAYTLFKVGVQVRDEQGRWADVGGMYLPYPRAVVEETVARGLSPAEMQGFFGEILGEIYDEAEWAAAKAGASLLWAEIGTRPYPIQRRIDKQFEWEKNGD